MKLYWNEILRETADAAKAGDEGAVDDAAIAAKAATDAAVDDKDTGKPNGADADAADKEVKAGDDKAKGGTLYDDLGVDKPGEKGSTSWPDDWRMQMAGGDEKVAKDLERYTSPDAVGKALIAAKQRVRSGEYKRDLDPDATPEQKAEWRKERGIPEDAKDYDVPMLMDGKYDDLDEFGKESIDTFRGVFHEMDLQPDHASKIMSVANEVAMKQMERQAEADANRQEETEDTLRVDWGAEYKKNIALNSKFMEDKFGESWQSIIIARTPEGLRLADDPKFNKFINDMARAEGGTVLETGEVVAGTNVQARIAEIKAIMQKNYAKYKQDGLDKEYSELLAGQSR